MYSITLIGTHHSEIGKCNSDELYRIIESISPDVIFEELSPEVFNRFYNGKQFPGDPPEVESIKRYLRNHNIEHVPVDIDVNQELSIMDIKYMFGTFKKYDAYKELDDQIDNMIAKDGFSFLNSKKCEEMFEEKKITEKNLMEFMANKNQLIRIWNLFYEEHENRDNEMLKNIYNYCKQNSFNRAIFTLGVGHRNSIIQKIQEYEKKEEFKLNWTFYDGLEN